MRLPDSFVCGAVFCGICNIFSHLSKPENDKCDCLFKCLSFVFQKGTFYCFLKLFKEFQKNRRGRFYLLDGRKLRTDSAQILIKSQSVLRTDVINTKRAKQSKNYVLFRPFMCFMKTFIKFSLGFFNKIQESVLQTLFLSGNFSTACF